MKESMNQTDWLTGLQKKDVIATQVNEAIKEYKRGVMFVLDVSNHWKIREQYGHLIADGLLSEIAAQLQKMLLRSDLITRVDEDRFAVFMIANQNQDFVEHRGKQICDRFKSIEVKSCRLNVEMISNGTVYQPGDEFDSMLERAIANIEEQIAKERKTESRITFDRGIEMDILRIQAELEETQLPQGAYYRGFEEFKSIYRFVERRMQRQDISAYILLMTLTDSNEVMVPFEKVEPWMSILFDVIHDNLRVGDVFAQYSSCQYIIMLSDLTEWNSESVAERVTNAFYERINEKHETLLLHRCYPMKRK